MITFKKLLLALVLPVLTSLAPMNTSQTISTIKLADKMVPTTVGFIVNMPKGKELGSGVIVSPNGYVISCAHVFPEQHGGITAIVFDGTEDGKKLPAHIIMIDRVNDLAILKLDGHNAHLKFAKLGDSSRIKRGEDVMAIGFPHTWALSWTVTTGIVSGLHRWGKGLIQSSAAINPGNSGGPLFNSKGEVIGINELIIGQMPVVGWSGTALSIPINSVKLMLFAAEAH